MTIDIEQLRKDMEAGTHGPNHSYLAGEYLALREVADQLAEIATKCGDCFGTNLHHELRIKVAAYRKATG